MKPREFADALDTCGGLLSPSDDHQLRLFAKVFRLSSASTVANTVKDFSTFVEFLGGHSHVGIELFLKSAISELENPAPPQPSVNEEVVQRHLVQLEKALGDDAAFTAAYKALERDRDAGKLKVATISKRFTYKTSMSRPAALNKILERHHLRMNLQR